MKKSKSSEPQDRLSELPDSLILLILSFLPMEDVVTTPLLSKRWKDLWTTIPCLNFSDDDSIHSVTFRNFVNRALMLWEGVKIQKFNISFNYYEVDSIYTRADVDLWLRFAIRNKVEELCVNLLNSWDMESGFDNSGCCLAPQRLYSCSSIRKLSLVGCELKIHGNVRWDQLKFLSIAAAPVGENVMDQILSGAPQLEVLILCRTESCENLNVHSSSLKTLKIKRYFAEGDDTVLTDTSV